MSPTDRPDPFEVEIVEQPLQALTAEAMVPELMRQITAYANQTATGRQESGRQSVRFRLPLINSGAPDDTDSVLTVSTRREAEGWRTAIFLSRTTEAYDTGGETQVGYFVGHRPDGSIDADRLETVLRTQLNASAAILLRQTLLRQQYYQMLRRR